MGQIKDTNKYPYDQIINRDDYLIGSDTDNNGQTKNFKLSDLGDFFAQYIQSYSDSTYYHVQEIPAAVWVITHNMNKYPTPLTQDEFGEVVLTDVVYINLNQMQIVHGRPAIGSTTLN